MSTDFYNLKFKMHQRTITMGIKFDTRAKKEGMSKTLYPVSVSMKAIIVCLHGIRSTDCRILAYRILFCLKVFYAQKYLDILCCLLLINVREKFRQDLGGGV